MRKQRWRCRPGLVPGRRRRRSGCGAALGGSGRRAPRGPGRAGQQRRDRGGGKPAADAGGDYDRLMDVNVRGYFLYAQAAYRYLARRRGCMIHIASDADSGRAVHRPVLRLEGGRGDARKMLAPEAGPDGVWSDVLCPGDTWPGTCTRPRPAKTTAPRAATGRLPPIGRIGQPGDVAAAAAF